MRKQIREVTYVHALYLSIHISIKVGLFVVLCAAVSSPCPFYLYKTSVSIQRPVSHRSIMQLKVYP